MRVHRSTGLAVLGSICVLAVLLVLNRNVRKYSLPPRSFRQTDEPAQQNERTDIFFLKTHKCGSSTVQNILMRFGYRRHLDFVLPLSANYIGHPKKFHRSKIPLKLRSPTRTYNIFTHHARYDFTETKAVMKDGAAFVTILREPAALFESLYQFYHLDARTNLTLQQLTNGSFGPTRAANLTRAADQRMGLDQMSFDLGFDGKSSVADFVRDVDHQFDLVMITEHMEASLVLLRRLMNWPVENVISLKLNSRQSARKMSLSRAQRKAVAGLNPTDARLYGYFLDKFKTRVREFGVEKMKTEVDELLRANSRLWSRCVDKANAKGYAGTLGYDLRDIVDYDCYYAAKQELSFTEEIREDQIRRFSVMANLDRLMKTAGDEK